MLQKSSNGPEEIHICFWEGTLRPPKRKCDRPKKFFLVKFQIRYQALVAVLFHMSWVAGVIEIKDNTAQALLKLELWLSLEIKLN